MDKKDLGERILSTLIELYADQVGVKVEYVIKSKKEQET